MNIQIPNKESIDIDNLKKVLIIGLKNTAGPTPAVFSFEIPIENILDLKEYNVSEDLIDQIDKIQFKYIHKSSIKLAYWIKDKSLMIAQMKINIPDIIKNNRDNVSSLWVETEKVDEVGILVDSNIFEANDMSLKVLGFVSIPIEVYDQCTKIQIRILYKNKTKEVYKFNHKAQALYRSKSVAPTQLCVRHKTSEYFKDTNEDRFLCLSELQEKFYNSHNDSIETIGKKNLIYYTIYFNKGYIELLNKSILSILDTSEITFDLLLITDEDTKKLILQQPFVKKIIPKFLITETPFDGIESSQNKILIFNYEKIKNYDKVLFLDCDVVCIKNINIILKEDIQHDILYTARNINLGYWHHKTFHHGFEFLGDGYVKEMTLAKQMPFNAGQFLFKVSDRMLCHFKNIKWFMDVWCGEYFFEQCFMNYYFCKNYLTDDSILQKYMSIMSTTTTTEYNFNGDTVLVHFIAPPLDAETKSLFINNFIEKHLNIKQTKWHSKLIGKIKNLFKK